MTTPDRALHGPAEITMPEHRQSVVQLLRDADTFLLNIQKSMGELRSIFARTSDLEATTLSKVSAEVIPLIATITTTAIAAGAVLGKLPEAVDGQESLFNLGERIAFAFNPIFQRPLSDRLRACSALEADLSDIREQVLERLQNFR